MWYKIIKKASDEDSSIKKYQPNNRYPSYLSVGHETGEISILWIHDGDRVHSKQIRNDINENGELEENGHMTSFDYQRMLASGRVDPKSKIGSITISGELFDPVSNMIYPNKEAIVNRILSDLQLEFPGVRFNRYGNFGRMTTASKRLMGYKVVAYDKGRAYSLYDKNFTYNLNIGSVYNNIYMGTSEQFCLDYYGGVIDEQELMLTFSYDENDIISGGGENSEVQVRSARLEGYRELPKQF